MRFQPEGTRPLINNSSLVKMVNLPSETFLISNTPSWSVIALWSIPSASVSINVNPLIGEPLLSTTDPATVAGREIIKYKIINPMLTVNHGSNTPPQFNLPIQTRIAVPINPIITAPIGCVRPVGKNIESKVKTAIINPMTEAIACTALPGSLGFLLVVIVTILPL